MIPRLILPYTDPKKMMDGSKKYGFSFNQKWGIWYADIPKGLGTGWMTLLVKDDIHFIRTNLRFHETIEFKSFDPVEELVDIRIRFGEEHKSSYLNGEHQYSWGMHEVNAVSVFIPRKHFKDISAHTLKQKLEKIQMIPSIHTSIKRLLKLQFEKDHDAINLEGELLKYLHKIFEHVENYTTDLVSEDKLVKINQAKEILDSQYFDAPTIKSISRIVGMNITDLQYLFKKIYGKTINQYKTELAINKAAELITQTSNPISQIVNEIGYNNRTHFNKLYKSTFGLTPSAHRRSLSTLN